MRLIALLFCACVSLAQAAGVTVQTLDVKGKNARGEAYAKGQMTLPVVKASQPADEALAKRINDRLAFLSTDGTESQQFTVSRNDDRLLTIAFDSEGCGAYCENYSTYYSFDLQDVTVFRRQSVHASRPADADGASAPGADHPLHAAVSYPGQRAEGGAGQGQQASRAKEASSQRGPARPFGNGEFEVAAKAFKLTAGHCSNHDMRALDDVGDATISLRLAGDELSGRWVSKAANKQFDIRLAP